MRRLLACLICSSALAQSPIADVHASEGKGEFRTSLLPNGRYEIRYATLLTLITTAWGVDRDVVHGGPSWLDEDLFDVIAQAPPKSTPADRALLLRSLLIERFGLATHMTRSRGRCLRSCKPGATHN